MREFWEEFIEICYALTRIMLGLILFMCLFIILDIIVYLGATNASTDKVVEKAYDEGYVEGYSLTYEITYQEAHDWAYDKGYEKGYEFGYMSLVSRDVPARVEIHNPTYEEMKAFLAEDETDTNPFIKGEYVCFDFAADLNNNAEAKGIRTAYVRIRAEEWGHALVAFDTTDKGIIYIDPQSDKEIELVIGEPYPWSWIGAIKPDHYNDPIIEMQILW